MNNFYQSESKRKREFFDIEIRKQKNSALFMENRRRLQGFHNSNITINNPIEFFRAKEKQLLYHIEQNNTEGVSKILHEISMAMGVKKENYALFDAFMEFNIIEILLGHIHNNEYYGHITIEQNCLK